MTEPASVRGSLFRPTRDRLLVLWWALALWLGAVNVSIILNRTWLVDGATYWSVWRGPRLYDLAPDVQGAYLYSPAFAEVIRPLTLLPWPVFSVLWVALAVATYLWLVRPLRWVWAVPLLILALEDATIGNVTWLVAACLVLGFRWAGWWAVPVLLKVSPVILLVWFVARREWRSLAVAIGTGLGIAAVSALLAPQLWAQWFAFLVENRAPGASVRLVIGALLVWWAARRDRAWLLPVALFVATPVVMAYSLGLLCAVPRLLPAEVLARAREPFGGPVATTRRILDLA